MKYLCVLGFLLTFSICAAQDPQLFENTWYLHNVIIDGQVSAPPSNSEVPFIPLDFFEDRNDDFMTSVCNSFFGTLIYDGNQNFIIQDYALTLVICDFQENAIFEKIYFSIFFDPNTQDPYSEPFLYTIIVNGNDSTLTIENVNGGQAFYGNNILSRKEHEISKFSIHPNPVKNQLLLTSKSTPGKLKVKIFNIEGKLLSTQDVVLEKQASVDVSNLSSGIYFLNIENERGNSTIKKFLKE